MKRMATAAAVVMLAAGSVFAQGMAPAGEPGPGPSWGPMGGIDWKVGTSVTIEDKKLTGQLVLGERVEPVFKSDGVEYILTIPNREWSRLNVKNGDTMTVEGLVVTVKSDATAVPRLHALKVNLGGKDYDLEPHRWGDRRLDATRGPAGAGPRP